MGTLGVNLKVLQVIHGYPMRYNAGSEVYTQGLAQLIEDKPGWNFDLLLVGEPETLASPEDAHPFVPIDVIKRIGDAEKVRKLGLYTGAFILAWSALEAVARILSATQWADDTNIATSAFTLERAFALGVLSPEDYEQLAELLKLRKAVVHGFSVKDVDDDLARDLIGTVRKFQAAVPHAFMQAFMRRWFLARYEDPVHSLTYDSDEGGYIWLNGEPPGAHEVLREEFYEVVPEKVIEALADDLSGECLEWTPKADPDEMFKARQTSEGLCSKDDVEYLPSKPHRASSCTGHDV